MSVSWRTRWADRVGMPAFLIAAVTLIMCILHLVMSWLDDKLDWEHRFGSFLSLGSFWNAVLIIFILATVAAIWNSKYSTPPGKSRWEIYGDRVRAHTQLFDNGTYSDLPFILEESGDPTFGRCYLSSEKVGCPSSVARELQTLNAREDSIGLSVKPVELKSGTTASVQEKITGSRIDYDAQGTFQIFEKCFRYSHETAGLEKDLRQVSAVVLGSDNRVFIHLANTKLVMGYKFPITAPAWYVRAILNRARKDRESFVPSKK